MWVEVCVNGGAYLLGLALSVPYYLGLSVELAAGCEHDPLTVHGIGECFLLAFCSVEPVW